MHYFIHYTPYAFIIYRSVFLTNVFFSTYHRYIQVCAFTLWTNDFAFLQIFIVIVYFKGYIQLQNASQSNGYSTRFIIWWPWVQFRAGCLGKAIYPDFQSFTQLENGFWIQAVLDNVEYQEPNNQLKFMEDYNLQVKIQCCFFQGEISRKKN